MEVAEAALTDPDRHPEERPHPGMVGREATRTRIRPDVAEADRAVGNGHLAKQAATLGVRADARDRVVIEAVVHEPLDAAGGIVDAEHRVPGVGDLGRAAHHPVEDLVEVVLGRERQRTLQQGINATVSALGHPPSSGTDQRHGVGERTCRAPSGRRGAIRSRPLPRSVPVPDGTGTVGADHEDRRRKRKGGVAMLMLWFLGHTTLVAFIVMLVGLLVLAALLMYRIALHAASYVEISPVRVRPRRRGPS